MTFGVDLFGVGEVEEEVIIIPSPVPFALPAILRSGYGISPADQVVRTDMEIGKARVRRRTAARDDQLQVQWSMNSTEFEGFRDWFDRADGAAGGAAWVPVDVITDGAVENKNVRFVGIFKATHIENSNAQFLVQATLEVDNA